VDFYREIIKSFFLKHFLTKYKRLNKNCWQRTISSDWQTGRHIPRCLPRGPWVCRTRQSFSDVLRPLDSISDTTKNVFSKWASCRHTRWTLKSETKTTPSVQQPLIWWCQPTKNVLSKRASCRHTRWTLKSETKTTPSVQQPLIWWCQPKTHGHWNVLKIIHKNIFFEITQTP